MDSAEEYHARYTCSQRVNVVGAGEGANEQKGGVREHSAQCTCARGVNSGDAGKARTRSGMRGRRQ